MFAKELRQAGHTKRFTISEAGNEGWEVRVEQDSEVVRRVHYTDWHRVERAVWMMSLQVSELEDNGWLETQPS
jgi:predicted alpha/beta hydrolase family esterase